ncbi:MAG: UDP-N-acetylmuramoyl-L-alanine--D-glutamate ligase [Bacteroidota bacterium]|nr:UDP-N-acetylmuramoyl-L-alanine--D-glutamate ligase [Bacteroidota bacterium]
MIFDPDEIRRSRVSVIGAARSGVAAARLLKDLGTDVLVSEVNPEDSCPLAAELHALGIAAEFGGHSPRVFEANLLVVSPGVPSDAPVLQDAARHGIPVVSEIELAAMFCPAPIAAVTGTNGKTTTTALTGEIFRAAGWKAIVAGNIGYAFSEALLELRNPQIAVLEVSSFQLDFTARFHPAVAVITNLTPDHLGRYQGDFRRYVESKQRVFRNQGPTDALVYNDDDPHTVLAVQPATATLYPTSVKRLLQRGGWMEGRTLVADIGEGRETIASIDELPLRGRHNYMNVLQAALTARMFGIPPAVVSEAVRSFRGVEHRLEFVRNLDGVQYVNDSKATNVDSVVIALESIQQPVILIAGGRDKGSPYDPLLPLIEEKVRAVVLIGEAAERMARAFAGKTEIHRTASLNEAVQCARNLAKPGDVVLLSPACASFDMFENFEHRGLAFKRCVLSLEPRGGYS